MNEEQEWPPGTVAKIDWQDAHSEGQSGVLARADDGFWLPILDETSPAAMCDVTNPVPESGTK